MLKEEVDSLAPGREFSRRGFVQTTVGSGFAAAVLPRALHLHARFAAPLLRFLDGNFFAADLDFFTPLLDEQHRHRLAEVLPRGPQHLLAARRIEFDRHARALVGGSRRCIDQLIARDDQLALQQYRPTLTIFV